MAVTLTNKANSVSTSNGFETGSIAWTAGSRGIVFAASALTTGSVTGHTVTGGGVTWTQVEEQIYGARRGVSAFVSDGTPTTGALTITALLSGGTYQETQWSVEEFTDFDTGTPTGAAVVADAAAGTSLNMTSLGAIDAGDLAVFVAGFEGATDSLAVAAGSTQHILRQNGGNVRSLLVGKSTTDSTPGVTWATDGNGIGMVGFIINAAAGGGGSVATVVPLLPRPTELPIMQKWPSGLVWRGAVPPDLENDLMSMRQLFVLP